MLHRVQNQRVTEDTFKSARAAHSPMTTRAPDARSVIAASANVLVVVTTSSTSQMRSGTHPPPRELNAPRILRRRSRRSKPVWLGVSRVRRSATASNGTSNSRARDRAICAAGLKPRHRSRRGWSGMGTIRSGGGPGARAAASRSIAPTTDAGAGSSPRNPLFGYLNRWIHSAPAPSNRAAATHAVSGEPEISQPAQMWLPNCGATSWHNRHARIAIRSSRALQPEQSTAVGSVGVPQPPQAGGSTNSSAPRESSASLRKASAPILVGHKALCSPEPNGVSCSYDRAKNRPGAQES